MEMIERIENGIVVLELSGKIMGGPDAATLNEKLHDLVESGNTRVVADLSNVNWMNSSGLGILINALTTIRNAGGDLKLASITEKIKSLLKITKLLTVFSTYDNTDDAVKSFLV
ncbi:STAS domain-containing protein [candidate division KSB1 bacterium]|nr:STAS domain-containing protein [candidate division KSB1 bacterium]